MENKTNEQLSLEMIEKEIQAELNTPESAGIEEPAFAGLENASRKPFQIKDFNAPRDREMAVFTHAKKLSEYIFVITEKSPKKLRWSIVTRLQNASVELIENLYRANFEREEDVRLNYQKSAAVSLRLIDFYTETARKKQAITVRQTAIIARQLAETEKLLNGWVKSTKKK
ncbi:MAG: four helix bundle protein [Clostridiales bacterium]|nr:four helix bundle protein [Clostridiales bacterium]